MRTYSYVVAGLAMSAAGLFADQITLKNGDRLTGAIVKSDDKNLTIKAEFGGAVTVPLEAVTLITASSPIWVSLKDGQTLVGTVATVDSKILIQTKEAGEIAAPKVSVVAIRSKDEETRFETETERLRNPRLRDLWAGYVDLGLSSTRGNSETTNFTLSMNASRATSRDKITTFFTSLYAKSKTNGQSLLTAEATRGGLAYDLNLGKKTFAFGFTNLEEDKFQKLDLRFVGGGGGGYHAIKTDRTVLDFTGGGSVNREFYSTGLNRTSAEVLVGEELTYKLRKTTQFHEKFALFPNLSDTGQYRLTFDAGAVTSITKWLGWQATVSDRYVSNPVNNTKSNDILFTTGLRLTFAK